jgi:aspartyl/asparaginyl beta-hydroxylase (cupin superfamily)
MINNEKLWFSAYSQAEYKGSAPVFYLPKDFSWSSKIEKNYLQVFQELEKYLQRQEKLVAYFNKSMVSKAYSWKTIPLMAWGVKFKKNYRHFPYTMQLLQEVPGLVSLSFNLLEPHSTILPHFGDTNAIVRCHLGLAVPGATPEIAFQVKDEVRSWEKGKLLMFCDGYTHTAWNNTEKPRYILLFDVVLPSFLNQKNKACSTVLASLFLQSTAQKLRITKTPPKWILFPLFFVLKCAACFSMPLYNLVGKIRYKKIPPELKG